MTDQQHPITPPPELVENWYDAIDNLSTSWKQQLATQAAQWGADQELFVCCEQLDELQLGTCYPVTGNKLYDARRPKPPSLKEQAYVALDAYIYGNPDHGDKQSTYNTIRRALEQLND